MLTQRGEDLRLYLNGNLQFSSVDEYRYHEILTHLPAAFTGQLQRALVIGGGDGLAVRELLKYPELQSVDVVDLDVAVTDLAKAQPQLTLLNNKSLSDQRTTIINADAWNWLAESGDLYDLILIDLPDPESEEVAKLYSCLLYTSPSPRD